jgi:hypothetical protein
MRRAALKLVRSIRQFCHAFGHLAKGFPGLHSMFICSFILCNCQIFSAAPPTILCMAASQGPNFLFCMPNGTHCEPRRLSERGRRLLQPGLGGLGVMLHGGGRKLALRPRLSLAGILLLAPQRLALRSPRVAAAAAPLLARGGLPLMDRWTDDPPMLSATCSLEPLVAGAVAAETDGQTDGGALMAVGGTGGWWIDRPCRHTGWWYDGAGA